MSFEDLKRIEKPDFHEDMNPMSDIKHVIGIISGKGGVGKSTVTAAIATMLHKEGMSVGILDADITGPSIPKIYGVHGPAVSDENGAYPVVAEDGTKIMSINLILDNEETPVIWRGPVIAGAVKQFWTDIIWGELDYLLVDMPPGTGDVPLTVFQSLPVDGVIIVTSPQDLVRMVVTKAYNMAKQMDIPVLGLIENFGYLSCPDCGKKIFPFGEGNVDKIAAELGIKYLGTLPLDPEVSKLSDAGEVYKRETPEIENAMIPILSL
ncbi:MAG: Mrp/NBP35 family ATP-binding protein [Lachnospiraceae bacterium]|nr:Mrp/NBP35 family ATP-binding protein [Lachnospiraceae bacterium]